MADDPIFPPSMRFLIWREWMEDPATEPLVAAEVAARAPATRRSPP